VCWLSLRLHWRPADILSRSKETWRSRLIGTREQFGSARPTDVQRLESSLRLARVLARFPIGHPAVQHHHLDGPSTCWCRSPGSSARSPLSGSGTPRPAVVGSNGRGKDGFAVPLQCGECAGLVGRHEPRVTDNVGCEDRRQSAVDAFASDQCARACGRWLASQRSGATLENPRSAPRLR
jgi:hypothetical protein